MPMTPAERSRSSRATRANRAARIQDLAVAITIWHRTGVGDLNELLHRLDAAVHGA